MKPIPTAEELFKDLFNANECHIDYDKAGLETIKKAMIEFAKLHVKACTTANKENKTSLNSYPLSLIQ